ncbi:branched-chain amino acid ABC transporter permease [Sporanaerobium hydrogeniformans]|uniref:Branched-chain amino acid ABC transporter permease n=1 Tax=Sporanaerobium hydrogeniformans TaxID=3072179 RepID=A0AC61D9M8_9FIRM|nr:AzlC family ABC transporter permease [Sporanaerobium hydrogeniformans]PHV70089.1 branched-chain amino acid ABC transporter permease [Sporanaerobium hydrogeniformans]
MNEKVKALKAAFPCTLPVLTGFGFLGIAYGILMQSKGYGAIWSLLMSLIAFGGSMQFVAVTLLATGFDPLQAFYLSLIVNARHLFYGISMLEKYRGLDKLKFFLIYTLCDETFSIVCNQKVPEGVEPKWFYFFVSLLDYSYWAIASFLGGCLGQLIDIKTKGLDFALTALFVVIFVEGWKDKKNRIPAVIGVVTSILCLVCFGEGNFIIPAMVLILVQLTLLRKSLTKVYRGEEIICS